MNGAEGSDAPKDPLLGQIIQGRYVVNRAIGKGGMGVVYEAQHLMIGRRVALKTLTPRASLSPATVERFRREAQAAAAVGSSHIVDVLDMGQLESGSFFIVMEHLDGTDLGFSVALERCFSVARAAHVLTQLCDALAAVHAAGIVHRDLKPENIFLITRDGRPDFVKVLDFGVCKFTGAQAPQLTDTGDTVGTPLFMAPEQVEGKRDIDQRTDIYALGAILYFLLTGRAPFSAASLPRLFMQICNAPPPSVRSETAELPPDLDAIVQRALSKNREGRFQSCAELKAALAPFVASPALSVRDTIPQATAREFVGHADDVGDTLGATAAVARSLSFGRAPLLAAATLGLTLFAGTALAVWHFVRAGQISATPPPVAALARMPGLVRDEHAARADEPAPAPTPLVEPEQGPEPVAAPPRIPAARARVAAEAALPAQAEPAPPELDMPSAVTSVAPAPSAQPPPPRASADPEISVNREVKRDL